MMTCVMILSFVRKKQFIDDLMLKTVLKLLFSIKLHFSNVFNAKISASQQDLKYDAPSNLSNMYSTVRV